MERPQMRMSGPVLDTNDVGALVDFYERFLGWNVEGRAEARPGFPPGDGWAVLRPDDRSNKVEIQYEQHFVRPVYPGAAGEQGMQLHLDFWVEDLEAGVAWAKECGASEAAQQPEGRDPSRLRVMLDPAGHPFCLWS
jgi:catechol 2,3-dioxygenase-like lactoylglutathione lyase family enzyme